MLTAEKRHDGQAGESLTRTLPAPAVSVRERTAEAMAISSAEHFFPVAPVSGRRSIRRRLAAILGADIVGYSCLMGRAEEETHRRVGAEIDRASSRDRKIPRTRVHLRRRWSDG